MNNQINLPPNINPQLIESILNVISRDSEWNFRNFFQAQNLSILQFSCLQSVSVLSSSEKRRRTS